MDAVVLMIWSCYLGNMGFLQECLQNKVIFWISHCVCVWGERRGAIGVNNHGDTWISKNYTGLGTISFTSQWPTLKTTIYCKQTKVYPL